MRLRVDSDCAAARHLLDRIAALCAARGASWHADMSVLVRNGEMHVMAPAGTRGPLISMPRTLLMPLDEIAWEPDDTRLVLRPPLRGLSPEQAELLHLHVALFNATGKMRWLRERHPMPLMANRDALATAVAALRPVTDGMHALPTSADIFMASRSLRLRGSGGAVMRVLHPLLELLDHHHAGPSFRLDENALSVDVAQPTDSPACYASYGSRRDVLDLALHYGYLDMSTPFAHSAPLDLEIEGIGRVIVQEQRSRPPHPLDPPQVHFRDDGVTLSHLCCHAEHPERLRSVVVLALCGAAMRRGASKIEAEQCALGGLRAIGRANAARLAHLVRVCETEGKGHAGAAVLAAAARRQADIIGLVMHADHDVNAAIAAPRPCDEGRDRRDEAPHGSRPERV